MATRTIRRRESPRARAHTAQIKVAPGARPAGLRPVAPVEAVDPFAAPPQDARLADLTAERDHWQRQVDFEARLEAAGGPGSDDLDIAVRELRDREESLAEHQAAVEVPSWLRDGHGRIRQSPATLLAKANDPDIADYQRDISLQEVAMHPEATRNEFREAFDRLPLDIKVHTASQLYPRRDLAEPLVAHRSSGVAQAAGWVLTSADRAADRDAAEAGAKVETEDDRVVYGHPAHRLHAARTSTDPALLARLSRDSEPWVRAAAKR